MKAWLIVLILSCFKASSIAAVKKQNEMENALARFGNDGAIAASIPNKRNSAGKSLIRRTAATSTKYSQTVITWGAGSKSCAGAATTVTIACALGGKISIGPGQSGVSKCTIINTNTLQCTKLATTASAYVSAKCTGKYSVTASVPAYTFTNCKNSVRGNNAYQIMNLAQVCAVKANVANYTGVYSKLCTPASYLYTSSTKKPFCNYQSYNCKNTTKTTCSIATTAVKISSPATVNSLCILG